MATLLNSFYHPELNAQVARDKLRSFPWNIHCRIMNSLLKPLLNIWLWRCGNFSIREIIERSFCNSKSTSFTNLRLNLNRYCPLQLHTVDVWSPEYANLYHRVKMTKCVRRKKQSDEYFLPFLSLFFGSQTNGVGDLRVQKANDTMTVTYFPVQSSVKSDQWIGNIIIKDYSAKAYFFELEIVFPTSRSPHLIEKWPRK